MPSSIRCAAAFFASLLVAACGSSEEGAPTAPEAGLADVGGRGNGSTPCDGRCVAADGGSRVVVFGEYGEQATADTWTWDGATWSQQSVAQPPPRAAGGMALLHGELVLFGGGLLSASGLMKRA
jgi:hypothetical protein